MDVLTCWLALARAPASNRTKLALLRRCADIRTLFDHPLEIAADMNLSNRLRGYLRRPDRAQPDADREWLESAGCLLIYFGHPDYPALLTQISDPPVVLFVQGRVELLSFPQIAVVGSRNPSAAGRQHAARFSRELSATGLVVTSGLAAGIDAVSHKTALDSGGATVAVAGNGLDETYPAANKKLAGRIRDEGVLVSEFPPGTPPRGAHFPQRNRVISGLSLGVIVVEAAIRSGSLITARLAAEQGREVFAVPGSIDNPLSRGCHRMINDGAKLVERVEDVTSELGVLLNTIAASAGDDCTRDPQTDAVRDRWDGPGKTLLDALGHDPATIDSLVQRTGLTAGRVSSILLALEIDGHVASAPGGIYFRTTGSLEI